MELVYYQVQIHYYWIFYFYRFYLHKLPSPFFEVSILPNYLKSYAEQKDENQWFLHLISWFLSWNHFGLLFALLLLKFNISTLILLKTPLFLSKYLSILCAYPVYFYWVKYCNCSFHFLTCMMTFNIIFPVCILKFMNRSKRLFMVYTAVLFVCINLVYHFQ